LWKSQRRFTLRHLRDFGFGKQKMDSYIHDEVSILYNAINSITQKQSDHREVGLDLLTIMPAVAINTLWYIIAGIKHEMDDANFLHLTKLVLKFFRLGNPASPVLVSRFLQKIPIINSNFRQQEDCGDEINRFVKVFTIYCEIKLINLKIKVKKLLTLSPNSKPMTFCLPLAKHQCLFSK